MFKVGCALYYSMAELGRAAQFGHGIVQCLVTVLVFVRNTGRLQCAADLEHLYRIYSIPTHDRHQWLLLQFIVLLMMKAKGVRNM